MVSLIGDKARLKRYGISHLSNIGPSTGTRKGVQTSRNGGNDLRHNPDKPDLFHLPAFYASAKMGLYALKSMLVDNYINYGGEVVAFFNSHKYFTRKTCTPIMKIYFSYTDLHD